MSSFPEYHSPIGFPFTSALILFTGFLDILSYLVLSSIPTHFCCGKVLQSRMTLAWIRELAPVIIHINLPVIGEFLSFLGIGHEVNRWDEKPP